MLLSDRDIRIELDKGRVVVEPYDESMLQPSSIDFRLDKFFRVFENHRYPHIDPAADQSDLTRMVETEGEEPFILHPGEFVLGSTLEVVTLPEPLPSPDDTEDEDDEHRVDRHHGRKKPREVD